jgi:hypothetical protein
MKILDQEELYLLNNRSVFEKIHHLKSLFVSLFSELANELPSRGLQTIHAASLGIKISKGNELQHCPYQVLDIIRDFDKELGFNIRILNWWGRGLFIFVFLGKDNQKLTKNLNFFSGMVFHGYLLSKSDSPWDYKEMIDKGNLAPLSQTDQLNDHLQQLHYIQLVKKIVYPDDYSLLKPLLKEQVLQILNFYKG